MDLSKASDIVRTKLLAQGGSAVIPLLNGDCCQIVLTKDGTAFTSDKLNRHHYLYKPYWT